MVAWAEHRGGGGVSVWEKREKFYLSTYWKHKGLETS